MLRSISAMTTLPSIFAALVLSAAPPLPALSAAGPLLVLSAAGPLLVLSAAGPLLVLSAAQPLLAQSPRPAPEDAAAFLPSDVSFVVRVDAGRLAQSPLLQRLLEHPQAANPLARALARPGTLARIESVYVGLPRSFTPETRELPVLLTGAFDAEDMLDELAAARGVERLEKDDREYLVADDALGTSHVTALGQGVLALGDPGSVERMLAVRQGRADAIAPALLEDLRRGGSGAAVAGVGRVPVALRGYLQANGGNLAAPFATVDRLAFQGSLGRAVELRLSLSPATAEGRDAIQQALGALRMFGPSRFADDPEVLSAIQSLRFTVGPRAIDVSVTLPRSLLLDLL